MKNFYHRLILSLICLFCTHSILAQNPLILVLGDSLSAAYGIPVKQGWVHALDQKLAQEGYAYTLINASISGNTSQNALSQLGPLLQDHHPSIVIVAIGANDALRGLSLQAFKQNLDTLLDNITKTGAKCLLLGMKMPPNYGPEYSDKFEAIYHTLAKKPGVVAFVPFMLEGVATEPKYLLPDQLHPNEAGQKLILKVVWPALKPLLYHGS